MTATGVAVVDIYDETVGEVIDIGTEVAHRVDVLRDQSVAVQERTVTIMLTEARQRLMAATAMAAIVEAKTLGHTLNEVAKQLRLGRELRLDAEEFLRRAERSLGLAIREGQARGEILRRGQVGPNRRNQWGPANEDHVEHAMFTRPTDFASPAELSGAGRSHGIYAMTDNVTDEIFESTIAAAREEGNLSRARVARDCRTRANPVAADPLPTAVVQPVRRKTALGRKTIQHMAITVNAIALGVADVDPAEVDADAHRAEIEQLQSDLRKIVHFLGKVTQ